MHRSYFTRTVDWNLKQVSLFAPLKHFESQLNDQKLII